MLFNTALSWELERTFWNAGIAIAARRPMMTTTIMISTRVKPLVDLCIFMGVPIYYVCFIFLLGMSSEGRGNCKWPAFTILILGICALKGCSSGQIYLKCYSRIGTDGIS